MCHFQHLSRFASIKTVKKFKKDDLATDFICGIKESKKPKMKPKLWMVEKGRVNGLILYQLGRKRFNESKKLDEIYELKF